MLDSQKEEKNTQIVVKTAEKENKEERASEVGIKRGCRGAMWEYSKDILEKIVQKLRCRRDRNYQ